jgi:hypothetical protein
MDFLETLIVAGLVKNVQSFMEPNGSLPLDPTLGQLNPVHILTLYLFYRTVSILSSHLRLCLPNGLRLWSFDTKTDYEFLAFPTRATCHMSFILNDLVTIITFGEDCKVWRALLGNILQILTSSLVSPNILGSTLFSNTTDKSSSLRDRPRVMMDHLTFNVDTSMPA